MVFRIFRKWQQMFIAVPFELSKARWQRTTTQDDSRQECWFNGSSWIHQPQILDSLSGWPFFLIPLRRLPYAEGGSGSAPTTHRSWAFGLTFSRFNCALSFGRLVYRCDCITYCPLLVHDNEINILYNTFQQSQRFDFVRFPCSLVEFFAVEFRIRLSCGRPSLKCSNPAPAAIVAGCICAFFGDELEKGQATQELYNMDTTVVIYWEVKVHAGNATNKGSRFECVCFFHGNLRVPSQYHPRHGLISWGVDIRGDTLRFR